MKPLAAALAIILAVGPVLPGPAAFGQSQRAPPPDDDGGSIRITPGPTPPPRPVAPKPSTPAPGRAAAIAPSRTIDAGAPKPTQLAPVSSDGQSTVVEALEVIGHAGGPAMWTASRGASEVVIVGTYRPLPHSLAWDQARLDRALDGATALYVPKTSVGVIGGAGLVLTMGSQALSGGRRLPEVIGPGRMAHLRALALRSHSNLAQMMTRKPAVVGYTLYGDFVRAAGFSLEKPDTTVQRLARARRVPIRPLARINAAPLLRSLEKLDEAGQLACYDAALAQVEAISSRGGAAAGAWSKGRLADLRALQAPGLEDACLSGIAGSRAVMERGTTDSVASIEDALKSPGRSVALVPIEYLTRRQRGSGSPEGAGRGDQRAARLTIAR